VPLRVPVEEFRQSKSQRRCWRKNQDLLVEHGPPAASDEKFDLYRRYMTGWHGSAEQEQSRESFEAFLYDSPVDTAEFCYRDAGGTLLAVGICDLCGHSLSSVYFYHDPAEARRSLGTFGVLYEIEFARRLELPHYYLGYWVEQCAAMQYKASFRPCEVLHADGVWRRRGEPPDETHGPLILTSSLSRIEMGG
jgi:arginine-tRNA-protein transferase